MADESTFSEKRFSFIKQYDTLIVTCIGILVVIIGFCYVADFFKTYQTLIVGYFGFLGVMWTLKSNARLPLEQHEREIRHQRKRTRIALLQELKINSVAIDDAASVVTDAVDDEKLLTRLRMATFVIDDIYRSIIDRIGLLTDNEIYKVTDAYLYMKEHKNRLFLTYERDDNHEDYVRIKPNDAQSFLKELNDLSVPIKEAIQALESALPPRQKSDH